jgi:hypothetical protein
VTRTSRYLLTAGALAAVLAIALIAGFQLNERQSAANPSASPTPFMTSVPIVVRPSPTANPNVTPTPSAPTGSAIYNDDFGFVVTDPSTVPSIQASATANIRTESSNAAIASFVHEGFWVSPDGTQIAYWSARTPSEPSQLHIVRAENPQRLIALSGLSADETGGFIVWANDSSGVAYVIHTAPSGTSTIRTFNTRVGSSGPGQVILQWNESGKSITPIAWDRATDQLAVGVTVNSPDGVLTEYIVASTATSQATSKRAPVTARISTGTVRASSDAKLVLGLTPGGDIYWWPIDDVGAMKTLTGMAGAGKRGALWRPGTHQIGYIAPDGHALNDVFWLGDVDKAGPQQLCCVALGGVPPTATLGGFRADGSAVLLVVAPPTAGLGATYDYTLVRLPREPQGGLEYPTSGDRVTFQSVGRIVASVLLR